MQEPSLQIPGLAPRAAPGQHRSTAEVPCPRSMVGRVIGKNGETIKALQTYTGALIQIDQSTDPTRVTISGTEQSLRLAISMVTDICKGTFKGFALLRQLIQPQGQPGGMGLGAVVQPRPVYAPGYGLIPPSQLYGADDPNMAGARMPQIVGPRPVTVQLQPGMVQYVQQGDQGAPMMLGMPGALPGHALTQQLDGTIISSPVPVQQVYGGAPVQGGAYGTQVYYPPDFSSNQVAGNDQLVYLQQQDGTLVSLQPQQQLSAVTTLQGSTTGKLLGAAGAPGGATVVRPGGTVQPASANRTSGWPSGSGWVESTKVESTTMGQSAVEGLLGGSSNNKPAAAPSGNASGLKNTSGNNTGSQQGLMQVIGPEGKVFYIQQGSGGEH